MNARHCVSPFRPASLSHLASTHQEVIPSQRPPDGVKSGVRPEPATPGGTCRLPVPRGGVAAKCSAALKSEGGDPTRPGRPAPGGPAPSPASFQVPYGRRPVLLAVTGCRDGLCSGLRAQRAFNLIFLLLNTQGSIRARTRTLLLLLSSFFFVFFSSARGK